MNDVSARRDGVHELIRTAPDLPMSPDSGNRARAFVSDTCRRWGLDRVIPDAQIVVTELVENAVRHSRTGCTVTVERTRAGLTVAVDDPSHQAPVRRHPMADDPRGRGLLLVDTLCDDWGFTTHDGGKRVWATINTGR